MDHTYSFDGTKININYISIIVFTQDPKLYDKLVSKHGEQLDDKSLTICSGVDYTNINYQHVVCSDIATAKVNYGFLLAL